MTSLLRSTALSVFRRLPGWARDLLWLRTPAERWREYRVCRDRAAVAADLRRRLAEGPGPGILFLPAQTWFSTHFQRPQQMARALAVAGNPIVYCEPWAMSHVVSEADGVEREFVGVKELGDRLHLLRWPKSDLR